MLVTNLNIEKDEIIEKVVSLLNIHNKADYEKNLKEYSD